MIYKSVVFNLEPLNEELSELLVALLDDRGYEGVYLEEDKVTGYIPEEFFLEDALVEIANTFEPLSCRLSWQVEDIQEQNWNAVWESNFDPVVIDDRCVVRAPFHDKFEGVKHRITIEPKMSFGTGHHHTTRMILEHMLDFDFTNKSVLDMGCGTGVLAILAAFLGAKPITAIDYDNWAYENTLENCKRNNCDFIRVIRGSSDAIPNEKYDVILANINRNILIEQMPDYARHAHPGSMLFLSGLMVEDAERVRNAAQAEGYIFESEHQLEQWSFLIFSRK